MTMWHILYYYYKRARAVLYIIIIMCGTRPLWRWAAADRERAAFLFVHTRARNAHFEERKKRQEREREWAKRVRYLRHRNALVKTRPKVSAGEDKTRLSPPPPEERAKRLYSCLNTPQVEKIILCAFDVTCVLAMTYCAYVVIARQHYSGRDGYYQW